jgi:hypothetical protein
VTEAKRPLSFTSALAHLYSDPHRAFFRLLVDDLIARHHLRYIYDEETWHSHIACGDRFAAGGENPKSWASLPDEAVGHFGAGVEKVLAVVKE